MTWKQAFEAKYFLNTEAQSFWKEMYGTPEKQLLQSHGGSKYYYSATETSDEYIVVDARMDFFTVYNNRIYVNGDLYFDVNGDIYNTRLNPYYYVIPKGATQSSSSQVMPDDEIIPNGKYIIYDDN